MFGVSPSEAALATVDIIKKKRITNILELGAGQGRDTLFFAKNGICVQALDYSKSGVNFIKNQAKKFAVSNYISVKCFDIKQPLPFDDNSFDLCFSHMLYCMALTTKELTFLSNEIRRVLKIDGINIYTARNVEDADYKNGIHRGEDLYENGGFIVHFFSMKKIKQLSDGFEILNISSFNEGSFPRKLFQVTLRKIN